MSHPLLVVAFTALAVRAPAPAQLKDFAWALPVTVPEGGPLYAVDLPLAVLEGVQRRDLGDLRVFNAAGREVPFALWRPEPEPPAPATAAVPIFAVRGQRQQISSVALELKRDAAGALLEARLAGAKLQDGVAAYIIDLRGLTARPRALELTWAEGERASFVTTLSVQSSEDLVSFNAVRDASLAQLSHDGQALVRRVVPLGEIESPYVRLVPHNELPVTLVSARVEMAGSVAPAPRDTTMLERQNSQAEVHNYFLRQAVSLDRLSFRLPEQNSVVRLTLSSRDDETAPWTQHFSGIVYRLDAGPEELTGPELKLAPTRDRFFQVTVARTGGGSGAPELEVSWPRQRLLFVARGEPPFRVAYGSARAEPAAFSAEELAQLRGTLPLTEAYIGDVPEELAGEVALRIPPPPVAWRRYVLWAVLLAGVGVLALMALRLLREMSGPKQT